METNNGIPKINPQPPDNIILSEAKIAQEDPFKFEKECIAKLDEYLREQFPKTYNTPSLEDWLKALHIANVPLEEHQKFQEALLEYQKSDNTEPFEFKIIDDGGKESQHTARKRKSYGFFEIYVDSPDCSEGSINARSTEYINDKDRAIELFLLVVNLKEQNDILTSDTVIERCKETLKGKRILSLGDDTGSLSEVLKHFGAEPVGIEFDSQKVVVGRAGVFSEDGKPNTSLIQGDIWDLINDETELMKKLDGIKFDAVVSAGLFNRGSGGEVPNDSSIRNKYSTYDWFSYFILQTQRLLKERGCQIHVEIDTLSNKIDLVLRHKNEISIGEIDLESWGDYSADRKMNQMIEDMISSGKLELDPGGYRNLIVKK